MSTGMKTLFNLFKLRIGTLIMITALGGMAVASGPALSLAQVLVLALSVLVASASAGAFNQYIEADSDRLMVRTRRRAFASGALEAFVDFVEHRVDVGTLDAAETLAVIDELHSQQVRVDALAVAREVHRAGIARGGLGKLGGGPGVQPELVDDGDGLLLHGGGVLRPSPACASRLPCRRRAPWPPRPRAAGRGR